MATFFHLSERPSNTTKTVGGEAVRRFFSLKYAVLLYTLSTLFTDPTLRKQKSFRKVFCQAFFQKSVIASPASPRIPASSKGGGEVRGGGGLWGGGAFSLTEAEADCDSHVDLIHDTVVQVSHFFLKAAFIEGTYLLEKNDGILGETGLIRIYVDMSWKSGLSHTGGNSGGDHRWAIAVTNVILNYKNGTETALLRADHGAEIGIKNISTFNTHLSFPPFQALLEAFCIT